MRTAIHGAMVLAVLAAGCARDAQVWTPDLELKRVIVYRNGVAYFEREGDIDEEEVTFQVKEERVGDFLATLAVMEEGGSGVRSASFEVDEPAPMRPKTEAQRATVTLQLDGEAHHLRVGYVAESPIWRPSYRVVSTGEGGNVQLQLWGVVQNLTGEDWRDVKLSLASGAPLAFQSTLETPVVPPRPVLTDAGEFMSAIVGGETSLAEASFPPAPPSKTDEGEEVQAMDDAAMMAPSPMAPEGKMAPSKRYARAPKAAMAAPVMAPSPPRDVRTLASLVVEGSTARYDLPSAVTVPDGGSTMVMLLVKDVPGEIALLFAPDQGVSASQSHPFRVTRITNQTGGLLEKGPIAVFDRGAFVGQGVIDPLPAAGTATIPFALERGVALESKVDWNEQGGRVVRIASGALVIERDSVRKTHYSINNGLADAQRIWVKHARWGGSKLFEAPSGTEDNIGTGAALVPVTVGRTQRATLTVDERTATEREIAWDDPVAADAVQALLQDKSLDPAMRALLAEAWQSRTKLVTLQDENSKLAREGAELSRQASEVRASLKAVEKILSAADLKRDLVARLARISSRQDEITKRAVPLGLEISEMTIRLRELTRAIHYERP